MSTEFEMVQRTLLCPTCGGDVEKRVGPAARPAATDREKELERSGYVPEDFVCDTCDYHVCTYVRQEEEKS